MYSAIPFNKPSCVGKEKEYLSQVLASHEICGDGNFTNKCHRWLEKKIKTKKALLTTSCTHALEIAAILIDTQKDDEVIMPSYTFASTANAFVLRGAKIVFIDIDPQTMNMDAKLIETAITPKTKAIVAVHYAGVACDMDKIMAVANQHKLYVIEDAAHGVMSKYKNQPLGAIGHFGCFSFHETKNLTAGEGGALLINDPKFIDRAENIREKGTNRTKFWRGEIDKYTWVDIGSSYLPSELNAAYLYAQLEQAELINKKRLSIWQRYYQQLLPLKQLGRIDLPSVPAERQHNGHLFYIKCKDLAERTQLINYLKQNRVMAVFHYIPLHSSPAGKNYGVFIGKDRYTSKESERLLRLPLYYSLKIEEVDYIVGKIKKFYE